MTSALIGLPLLGAAVLLLGGRRTNAWGPIFAVLMSSSAFVIGLLQFFALLGKSAEERHIHQHLFDWIAVGTFKVPFGLHLDQLSLVFVLLITGVGSLIHVYSLGYMEHDEK